MKSTVVSSSIANLAREAVIAGEISTEQYEKIILILSGKPEKIWTSTPLGIIEAIIGTDSNYPAIYVDFVPFNGESRPAAAVECNLNDDNPDGEVRVIVFGESGNVGEDVSPTSISPIYDKSDLDSLKLPRLTGDAKDVVRSIGSNYEIIGGMDGLAVVRNKTNGECYRIDVQKL